MIIEFIRNHKPASEHWVYDRTLFWLSFSVSVRSLRKLDQLWWSL